MKKITPNSIIKILSSLLVFLSAVTLVNAQNQSGAISTDLGNIDSPVSGNLFDFAGRIAGFIQPLIGVTFLLVIVYGGYVRMKAIGNAEEEQKSNSILTAGVIGFLIVVLAPAIVKFIAALVGVQGNVL